jgi:hypothetical protein
VKQRVMTNEELSEVLKKYENVKPIKQNGWSEY